MRNVNPSQRSSSTSTITLTAVFAGEGSVGAGQVRQREVSASSFQRFRAMNISVSNTRRPTGTPAKRPTLITRHGLHGRLAISGEGAGGLSALWLLMAVYAIVESAFCISATVSISGVGIAIILPTAVRKSMTAGWTPWSKIQRCFYPASRMETLEARSRLSRRISRWQGRCNPFPHRPPLVGTVGQHQPALRSSACALGVPAPVRPSRGSPFGTRRAIFPLTFSGHIRIIMALWERSETVCRKLGVKRICGRPPLSLPRSSISS